MFRSLHMKLVLVLVLLIVSVMTVVGTFLISSVTDYNIQAFRTQMATAFTNTYLKLVQEATAAETEGEDVLEALFQLLGQERALQMGVSANRYYYVMDARYHSEPGGTDLLKIMENPDRAASEPSNRDRFQITPNMIAAMAEAPDDQGRFRLYDTVEKLDDYFDAAVALEVGDSRYIVGVVDNRAEVSELTGQLFGIIIRAMLFGLVAAILLSFLLSKTITTPIERLTDQAALIAAGDFSNKPEIYSNDEIGTLTSTFNDMAEVLDDTLKEAEGERNKLNTLFLHMADGVVAFDSTGKLLHVNPAAKRMLGRDISGDMTYRDIFPNVQAEEGEMGRENRFLEIDYSAKNRILKILLAPIQVGERDPGIMAVLHDITEERKLDQSRREFVANVSHELRTPLTNIKGYTETLLNIEDIDLETRRQFLTVVYNETDRMTRIVKDLLTLTRLDYNRMEVKMDSMDLRALALESQHSMSLSAEKAGLKLTARIPGNMPSIVGDRERIEQVIINVVSNAIKYNRPKGTIHMSGGWNDELVYIKVTDTGIGVPEEDLPHLFERFYRVDKARSRESGGTGMGLSIAREIAELHGGAILFDSKYGEGSEVTVSFPRENPARGKR